VLVARDGEIAYRRAAGFSDREARVPVRPDTLFRFASLTKIVVSAAAMALVERGALSLEDPVAKWIPEFRPALRDGTVPAIVVRQLLNHTAGLNYRMNEPEGGAYRRAGISDGLDRPGLSMEENLRRIASVPLTFQPGTAWAYSVAHDVLGEVLARASAQSLPDLVRRVVLEPLQMSSTGFRVVEPARLAVAYADGDPHPVRMNESLHVIPLQNTMELRLSPARAFDAASFPSGGTGLVGSAPDFLTFLESLRTGGAPILTRASVGAMTGNAIGDVPAEGRTAGWRFGFGTAVHTGASAREMHLSPGSWEWGGVYGNRYWVDPQRRISAVVLTNTAIAGMSGAFPDALRAASAGDAPSS
jgi:CubicO group peptidase (beta-lactamase class C family)